jgi:hypothetical protein
MTRAKKLGRVSFCDCFDMPDNVVGSAFVVNLSRVALSSAGTAAR